MVVHRLWKNPGHEKTLHAIGEEGLPVLPGNEVQ